MNTLIQKLSNVINSFISSFERIMSYIEGILFYGITI